MSFASRVKSFNRNLQLNIPLPPNISVLNPFRETELALSCADAFYNKYYSDNKKRWPILGINPGRFGGGLTGVPFTDFKRLQQVCDIDTHGTSSHEPSSEFIYRMIAAMGDTNIFYKHFYINSVCPLGFVIHKGNGKWVNYNYYDDKALYAAVKPFIIQSIQQQIAIGLHTEECFCLGKKNTIFLSALNNEYCLLKTITELPHPRFIVQYKRKEIDAFIDVYVEKLGRKA